MSLSIPGYKIIRTLGKGGMATVYLAVQEIFEREVALKVMARGLSDDPAFGQRFFREARIVSKLVHPNIVTVYDVGVHQGLYYLSMEYIDGQDLKMARNRLDNNQKIQVVQDIARALEFAGQKGYVHRDIKPENIMLFAADNRAVLMDFGIARAGDTDISVTQAGTAIGTPHYMSPEQAKGQSVDVRSDLYSLGIVFYLLLTGRVPYDGDSAVAIGIKHITQPLPILPAELAAVQPILNSLLAKKPQDRYHSPSQLVAALEALKGASLAIPEPEDTGVPLGAIPADPLATLIAPVATMVSSGVIADEEEHSFTLTNEAVTATGEPRDLTWSLVVAVLVMALVGAGGVVYWQKQKQDESPFSRLTRTESSPSSTRNSSDFIEQKRRAYEANPKLLPQLVAAYREYEKMHPANNNVAGELEKLARQQLQKIARLLDNADFEDAGQLIADMKKIFPGYMDEDLSVQEARYKRRDNILSLLANADRYRQQGAINNPPGANARENYETVLAIDPHIEPAREALAALDSNPLEQADTQSGNVLPKNGPAKAVSGTVSDRLARAGNYIGQGRLFSPADDCALSLLQSVLSQEPGNDQARKISQMLPVELGRWVKRWVAEGKYAEAKSQIAAAQKTRPGDRQFLLIQQQMEAAIIERNRSLLPQITDLRVSGYTLEQADEPQAEVISVSKNLFVRFRVTQTAAQTPLQLWLYEGARSQRLLKVPVSPVSNLATVKIEPPKGSFARGNYVLDLVTADQIVESVRFAIE